MFFARPLWLRVPTTKPLSATACVSFSRCFSVHLGLDQYFRPFEEFATPNGQPDRSRAAAGAGLWLRRAVPVQLYHDHILPAAQIDELTGHGDTRTMAILPFTSTVMLMSKLMLAGISSAPPERTRV